MSHPVVHFEIRARDVDQQRAFYANLFGWQVGEPDGPTQYRMVSTGPDAISGGMVPSANATPSLTFYVQVEDLEGTLQRAASLGAGTTLPPTPLPNGGRFAVMRDPEGNELGLLGS
jgi:predicted enzyme related to lactoylglutathione lyase